MLRPEQTVRPRQEQTLSARPRAERFGACFGHACGRFVFARAARRLSRPRGFGASPAEKNHVFPVRQGVFWKRPLLTMAPRNPSVRSGRPFEDGWCRKALRRSILRNVRGISFGNPASAVLTCEALRKTAFTRSGSLLRNVFGSRPCGGGLKKTALEPGFGGRFAQPRFLFRFFRFVGLECSS